jgi:CubicO group peptidase (beta-lactamase class C family)
MLCIPGTAAQEPASAPASRPALAAALEEIRERHKLPALAALIIEGDRIVESAAVGVRRAGSPEPVTINDRFHLGSCTKAMTATLIALLVEEGKLAWDTTLAEALPDLRDTMQPEYRTATIRQLLAHRAGLPGDMFSNGVFMKMRTSSDPPRETRAAVLADILKSPALAPPGEKFEYANSGYVVAGVIIERLAGRPWEEVMRARLFDPLGMTSAGFGAPGSADAIDEPYGHVTRGQDAAAVKPGWRADNPPALGPAGTVHASLPDWAKFAALHLKGARGEPTPILKPESFKTLHTPAAGEYYAGGWGAGTRDWAGRAPDQPGRTLSHAGSNTMWFCTVWIAPERNIAVMAATNRGGLPAEIGADEAVNLLVQRYLDRIAATSRPATR